MGLTAKQKAFCEEYLIDLNATQAAIRARYSVKTDKQMGTENLAKPVLAEYIQNAMAERSNRTEMDADYVLTEAKKNYELLRDRDELKEAHAYLKMVGDHTSVKAFDKTVKLEDARYSNFSDAELVARRNAIQKRIDEQG